MERKHAGDAAAASLGSLRELTLDGHCQESPRGHKEGEPYWDCGRCAAAHDRSVARGHRPLCACARCGLWWEGSVLRRRDVFCIVSLESELGGARRGGVLSSRWDSGLGLVLPRRVPNETEKVTS